MSVTDKAKRTHGWMCGEKYIALLEVKSLSDKGKVSSTNGVTLVGNR